MTKSTDSSLIEDTEIPPEELVEDLVEDQEMAELRWAYKYLEHPSLAGRLSNVLALPIEEGVALLPKQWQKRLRKVAEKSIGESLTMAIGTIRKRESIPANVFMHKFMAVGSGAIGGFFGPLTLLAELPFTTMLMMRPAT